MLRKKEDERQERSGRRDRKGAKGRFTPRPYILRKKRCRFCADKNLKIDYLDYAFLRRFTTERGKIIPSRFSGNCARHQRKLTGAIKRSRNIGLLPYLAE